MSSRPDETAETPALEISRLTHRFGSVVAVDDFNLSVAPGEVVCLLGPSGCGKTTLLRLIAGLEQVQDGQICIVGRCVGAADRYVPPEGRDVGLVFQDYALFPHLTVEQNIAFGLKGISETERRERVADVLARTGLNDLAGRYPHALSGGQQQRVALARALAPRPPLILLDEPFSGLDARLRDEVRDRTLHLLKQAGQTTIMVTHDAEEAMFMADRIAVMQYGRNIQTDRPDNLYYHPSSAFVTEFFSDVNRLAGVARQGQVDTPFGPLSAAEVSDGNPVEILIRPEALKLTVQDETPVGEGVTEARVLAARMLGRTSLVHLCTCQQTGAELHLHARVPGRFLPEEETILRVGLDREQAFVFPAKAE